MRLQIYYYFAKIEMTQIFTIIKQLLGIVVGQVSIAMRLVVLCLEISFTSKSLFTEYRYVK